MIAAPDTELPAQPNQGLIDGLAVLQALATHREAVSGKVLSEQLGLEHTKVNRLLKTLTWLGIAYRTTDRKYTSGPGMHVLAAQSLFASGLIQRALGPLEGLGHLKKVIALGVLWRDYVSHVFFWQPGRTIAEGLGHSALFPATQSSIGMSLLAARDDAQVRALYRGKSIPGYESVSALLEELRATRDRGFAIVKTGQGANTVGVAFGTPAYAGVAVSGTIKRNEAERYARILRETIVRIEREGD